MITPTPQLPVGLPLHFLLLLGGKEATGCWVHVYCLSVASPTPYRSANLQHIVHSGLRIQASNIKHRKISTTRLNRPGGSLSSVISHFCVCLWLRNDDTDVYSDNSCRILPPLKSRPHSCRVLSPIGWVSRHTRPAGAVQDSRADDSGDLRLCQFRWSGVTWLRAARLRRHGCDYKLHLVAPSRRLCRLSIRSIQNGWPNKSRFRACIRRKPIDAYRCALWLQQFVFAFLRLPLNNLWLQLCWRLQ